MIEKLFKMLPLLLFFLLASCTHTIKNRDKQVEISVTEKIIMVNIVKYQFVPKVVSIKTGQTIQWVNQEKRQYHSVWFKENNEEESDYLFPKDTLKKQFTTPGTYNYICGPHPDMTATIIVK